MSTVNIIDFIYLISAVLFMLGIKNLSSPATAKFGNKLSIAGMLVAILATLASPDMFGYTMIIIAIAIGAAIGGYAAIKVEMTSMPEMVALFNGCGGAASALVAMAEFTGHTGPFASFTMITLLLSVIIGGLTFYRINYCLYQAAGNYFNTTHYLSIPTGC